ncbi:hypothetical protein J6590_108522 [Homalodisca vitripennis]|nr:hypothetical protein J6590_108652 [Homalodisca vitripennis]KAG8297189.1 hypothetical protein J6590_108522 [Homalodisca vitripennis]
MLNQIAVCVDCGESLTLNTATRLGLSVKLTIKCTGCGKELVNNNDKMMNYQQSELNTRLVYGFRCIGKGEEAAKTCGVMDLSSPPAFKYYKKRIFEAVKQVCVEGFKHAVEETVVKNNNERDNLSILLDGTWQRRGHRSLNGVVTAVLNISQTLRPKIVNQYGCG